MPLVTGGQIAGPDGHHRATGAGGGTSGTGATSHDAGHHADALAVRPARRRQRQRLEPAAGRRWRDAADAKAGSRARLALPLVLLLALLRRCGGTAGTRRRPVRGRVMTAAVETPEQVDDRGRR